VLAHRHSLPIIPHPIRSRRALLLHLLLLRCVGARRLHRHGHGSRLRQLQGRSLLAIPHSIRSRRALLLHLLLLGSVGARRLHGRS
jgi:hypothetical protein